jgi:thioredoxin-like negative regulator of GroEL
MESIDVKSDLQALMSSGALFFIMITKVGCHPCKIAEPEVREYLRLVQVPFYDFDMDSEIGADLSERFKLKSAPSVIGFVNSKYVTAVGGKQIAELIEALIE